MIITVRFISGDPIGCGVSNPLSNTEKPHLVAIHLEPLGL
jgi:hypothetical protein